MTVSAITGTTPTTTSAPQTQLKGTSDEFLKLFMAQLQHQDPFAPTSGADMVGQLAQLSGVEQAKQTNDQLAELAASQASAASAGLSSLVGRDCSAATGGFHLDKGGTSGQVPPIDVMSPSPMKNAAIVITDANGKELRRIAIPNGATSATLAWDGRDASGNTVPPGDYKISVDAGASASTISSQWHGRVDGVDLTPDGTKLRMGGIEIAPGDIRTIGGIRA